MFQGDFVHVVQCAVHLKTFQSMTIYVPVEQVSHLAWQKGSRDLKGYNWPSFWIIAYTKNGLRKEISRLRPIAVVLI